MASCSDRQTAVPASERVLLEAARIPRLQHAHCECPRQGVLTKNCRAMFEACTRSGDLYGMLGSTLELTTSGTRLHCVQSKSSLRRLRAAKWATHLIVDHVQQASCFLRPRRDEIRRFHEQHSRHSLVESRNSARSEGWAWRVAGIWWWGLRPSGTTRAVRGSAACRTEDKSVQVLGAHIWAVDVGAGCSEA